MDPSKSTIVHESPSITSAQQPKSSSNDYTTARNMNPAAIRNVNIPASLYLANEISPETVMSELNMFRPTTTALPLWNGSSSAVAQGMNYSIISSPSTGSSPHMELDTANHNGTAANSNSQFNMFSGPSHEEPNSFQLSPKTFSDSGNVSGRESMLSNSDDQDEQDNTDESAPKRKKRTPVPDERKDAKYWARRKKNNVAAKRSRDMRRQKLDQELKSARDAITENQKLKQEIDVLKAEINSLRRLLKDANTTLSLWIRARQAAEPNVQLPPMLRGSNVSFVNFPVSSAT